MPRLRLKVADRKQAILDAAIAAARQHGFDRMTREIVASGASCSPSLVSAHFSTMAKLRRAVMRQAIAQGVASVVADGLRMRDSVAQKAPAPLIDEARALLAAR